jgi:glycosyltransferase involved in cell wall biosynthesis
MDRTEPLTVVMPVYNEEDAAAGACAEVIDTLSARRYDLELIVVDDCSRDRTCHFAREFADAHPRVRVIRHERNLGPCSGLASGARIARHPWVLLLPADLAIPLDDVDTLWAARATARPAIQPHAYTSLVNALFAIEVPQVNYVSLYWREIFERIELVTEGVARHAEILVRAQRLGYRLGSAPLGYRPREFGSATGAKPKVV